MGFALNPKHIKLLPISMDQLFEIITEIVLLLVE
jgi:hypothetical protein